MKRNRTLSLLLALCMTFALAVPALAAEYTVEAGDSLSKIAEEQLGDSSRWKEIYEANKDTIKNPNQIYVGQKLTIPGDEQPAATETPAPAAGKSATAAVAGFDGETVTVTVTVADDKITEVKAVTDRESDLGKRPLALMPKQMMEQNTVNVDAVSGATGTSAAILEAARKAMAQLTEQNAAVDLDAWALANGYVKAADYNIVTGVDAVASATTNGVGGVNFGAIEWSRELQEAGIKEFLKGGKYLGSADFAQDDTGYNYREMYQMATSYNNMPNNTNLELVLNVDSMKLMGVSEAGTSKTLQFQQNPNVSLSWCKQLRLEDEETGYNYYCSYGVTFNGTVKIYTPADLETTEGQKAVVELFDTYYPTLSTTWAGYSGKFAELTDADEIFAAKLAYAKSTIERGASIVYEIIPESIILTAPFLTNLVPQMSNALRFTTVQEGEDKYAYDLDISDAFIDKLIEYKNGYLATAEGKAAVETYYTAGPIAYMFQMLDGVCKQAGMPTSLEAALMDNNAAGLKTQTTWTPGK